MTAESLAFDNDAIRLAIDASLPADPFAAIPEQQLFLPWPHRKALQLDCSLVVGARGVGKTVWARALLSDHLNQESSALPSELIPYPCTRVAGFGDQAKSSHPDPVTYAKLIQDGPDSYGIWLAVLCRELAALVSVHIPKESWQDTVDWARHNHEEAVALIRTADTVLTGQNRGILFVFDALDRVSPDGNWEKVAFAIRSLLQLTVQLKAFKRIHVKIFLRTDQYDRGRFADLPDIAKVRSTRVELLWTRTDLHALFWQCLTNGPLSESREQFRSWCFEASSASLFTGATDPKPFSASSQRWELPGPVQQDESIQRALFERIAGRWMGRDSRRGVPYTWIVNHLADSQGQATPRSFVAALRKAAEESIHRYREAPLPLHYEALKLGVRAASDIRIDELEEDCPWLPTLMQPFSDRHALVPFIEEIFESVLIEAFGSIPDGVSGLSERLPNDLRNQGVHGLIAYMAQLGLLTPMQDHRLNMPDIYRIGFKLGRRGGIKPVPRTIAQPD
jgi:hypothetical protein